jgi:hypothetical protein
MKNLYALLLLLFAISACGRGDGGDGNGAHATTAPAATKALSEEYRKALVSLAAGSYSSAKCDLDDLTTIAAVISINAAGVASAPTGSGPLGMSGESVGFIRNFSGGVPDHADVYSSRSPVVSNGISVGISTEDYVGGGGKITFGSTAAAGSITCAKSPDMAALLTRDPYAAVEKFIAQPKRMLGCIFYSAIDGGRRSSRQLEFELGAGEARLGTTKLSLVSGLATQEAGVTPYVAPGNEGTLYYSVTTPDGRKFDITLDSTGALSTLGYLDENRMQFGCVPQ